MTSVAIATSSQLAADAAYEVAAAGGNAVDCALAAALLSMNTEPGVCALAFAFGGCKGRSQLPGMVNQYMDGDIKIDEFITYTMPLEDINRAFDLMHEGKSIRSVIHF